MTPIIWFDTIDSTNLEARRRMSGIDRMTVYAAKFQTAGRGQRGNRWLSAAGDNLTFSVGMNFGNGGMPQIRTADQFLISIVTALSVSGYLDSLGIDSRIKWPNDIYVRDRKICGILIENSLHQGILSSSISGIGLNLSQTEFSPELMNPTSVAALTGKRIPPESALKDFLTIFQKNFSLLTADGGKDVLVNAFVSRMYRLDRKELYRDCLSGMEFHGTIKGISEEGLLLVEMPDNSVKKFGFKEISYII